MKNKSLLTSLLAISLSLFPVVAFGAYNDVSLGTSAIVSINDSIGNTINLTVTGSADVVESITVGSTSFTVGLQSGSTLTVAVAGRNLITTSAPSSNYSTTCETSQSTLTLTSTNAQTFSVSVSPNACGAVGSTSSSSGSNGAPVAQSGGGGGGGTYIAPTSAATVIAASQNQATTASPTTVAPTSSVTTTSFAKVSVGSRVSGVITLQKVLNADSDTQIASSGVGSSGKETNFFGPGTLKALKKFQVKYGISKPGKSDYGVFGPKTKAKLVEVAKLKGI